MLGLYRGSSIFAQENPIRQAVDRIEKLAVENHMAGVMPWRSLGATISWTNC